MSKYAVLFCLSPSSPKNIYNVEFASLMQAYFSLLISRQFLEELSSPNSLKLAEFHYRYISSRY